MRSKPRRICPPKNRSTSALVFETTDVLKRVKKHVDLFAPVLALKQKLPR